MADVVARERMPAVATAVRIYSQTPKIAGLVAEPAKPVRFVKVGVVSCQLANSTKFDVSAAASIYKKMLDTAERVETNVYTGSNASTESVCVLRGKCCAAVVVWI